MEHPALSFKLPFTQKEQIEIRGALITLLVQNEEKKAHIGNLLQQLEVLNFILQEQIEEIKKLEEQCQTLSRNSLPAFRRNS